MTNKNDSPLVSFENVGLRYTSDKEILKNINFNLYKGDFIFLIGESGAGKSSFLNLINISLLPSRGFLSILDKDVTRLNYKTLADIRRKIGIIFQDFKLVNHLSVFDNIALPLKITKAPQREIKKKVDEILEWINLEKYKHYSPLHLSGGQQQRVAIARAVINSPTIILADEPTGSIDNNMASRIVSMLEELNKQGVAVVFATHNLELIEKKNYPVALLHQNQIQIIKNKTT
ncbi:Cell division ATP-binding protein FtsE [Candidatus Hepatincolaceae symbiont of Richtersius coronifer]